MLYFPLRTVHHIDEGQRPEEGPAFVPAAAPRPALHLRGIHEVPRHTSAYWLTRLTQVEGKVVDRLVKPRYVPRIEEGVGQLCNVRVALGRPQAKRASIPLYGSQSAV